MEKNMEKLDCTLSQSSGFCVRCNHHTKLVCHRCGDFYCSKKCQLQDWQRHRYICFAIPALVHPIACSALGGVNLPIHADDAVQEPEANTDSEVNVDKKNAPPVANMPIPAVNPGKNPRSNSTSSASSTKMPKNKELTPMNTALSYAKTPPNKSVVSVQGFRFPNRCYIREVNEIAEKAHLHISEQLQKVKELTKVTKLRCNQYALVKFMDKLHRVKVLEVQNYTLARLAFLDLGIVKMYKMNEVYEISCELLGLTCYTMLMQLKDVPNYTMGEDTFKFLAQFTGERFQITYSNKGCVELMHMNTQLSLNEQIRQFCSKRQVIGKQPTAPSLPKLEKPIEAELQTSLAKETIASEIENIQVYPSQQLNSNKENSLQVVEPKLSKAQTALKGLELAKGTIASEIKNIQESQSVTNKIAELCTSQKLNSNTKNSLEVVEPKLSKAQSALQALELKLVEKATLNSNEVKEEFTETAKLNAKAKDVPLDEKAPNIIEHPLNEETVGENQTSYEENFKKKNDDYEKGKINVKLISDATPVIDDSIVSQEIIVNVAKSSDLLNKPNPGDPIMSKENIANSTLKRVSSSTKEPEKEEQSATNQQVVLPCLHPPFELRRLGINKPEGLDVFIVDNSNITRGIIGAFDSECARDFSDLHFLLSGFKDSQPYIPEVKEYVIAKYERTWYRARVLEIKKNLSESLYNVVYLEFTNVATLSGKDIRRYPDNLTIPCHTNICLIEGFPHRPTTAQMKYLEENLQMHSLLHVDRVNYLQNMALIKCDALMQALIKLSK